MLESFLINIFQLNGTSWKNIIRFEIKIKI